MWSIYLSEVIRFLGSGFIVLYLALFLRSVYNVKCSNKMMLLFAVTTTLATTISLYLLMQFGLEKLKFIVSSIWMISLLFFFFKVPIIKGFILQGLITVITGAGNALIMLIFSTFGIHHSSTDVVHLVYGYFILNFFTLGSLMIIKAFRFFPEMPQNMRANSYKASIVHIILVVCIIAGNLSYYAYNSSLRDIFPMVNILFILGYFIFSMYHIHTSLQLEQKSKELEYQVCFNKTLQCLTEDLKRSKHNFNNVLAVIYGYIGMKNLEGLKNYVHDILKEEERFRTFDHLLLSSIKDAGILGILTIKLQFAASKGIHMKIEIDHEVKAVGLKNTEFYEILGILLDNAIEAAYESEEKALKLAIRNENGNNVFIIENSFKEIPDMEKMFERDYSSKGINRGEGLFIVRKVLNRYKNAKLNTGVEKGMLKQELIIS
ncbi:MAG: GHKL domain-containing protein [Clostridia bacterium]|nr:GHKL domain-containing protein [Clostridia bacterium]